MAHSFSDRVVLDVPPPCPAGIRVRRLCCVLPRGSLSASLSTSPRIRALPTQSYPSWWNCNARSCDWDREYGILNVRSSSGRPEDVPQVFASRRASQSTTAIPFDLWFVVKTLLGRRARSEVSLPLRLGAQANDLPFRKPLLLVSPVSLSEPNSNRTWRRPEGHVCAHDEYSAFHWLGVEA